MIAAVAVVNDLPLYTCNPDDFAGIDQLDVIGVPHPDADPVHFGSHRRNEAVLLSRQRYEQQEAAVRELEELERLGVLAMIRDRLADDQFSEGTVDDLFAAVDDST